MNKQSILTRMLGTAALAAMFAAGAAYAQSSPGTTGQPQAETSGASAGSSQAAGELGSADKKLMGELARANMAEIQAGQLALEKSKDDKVRSFAQKMVDDHTKAGEQLQELAQAKGVTLPTGPDAKHRAEIRKLSALSDEQFDKRYMAQGGVADHRKTHALVERIEKQAKDKDLKTLAASLKPTIDNHWQMAKDIHGAETTSSGASGAKGESASGSGK